MIIWPNAILRFHSCDAMVAKKPLNNPEKSGSVKSLLIGLAMVYISGENGMKELCFGLRKKAKRKLISNPAVISADYTVGPLF